ncbi:cytochrome b [Sphingomonas sp. CGMCC 1.13654]|uniref:Cytochrome b n=1 Tax=Sphingomonas chungangi TaxID=2683589 RepID=A0A838LBZ3_9SPHN|nr:cytochrome b [Sphingomonas chungangi]MBA2934998.1 cytochrome b [Sphingomonas chungangi]MVW54113.1 cytochrome b [Sphingomonas chungangi]
MGTVFGFGGTARYTRVAIVLHWTIAVLVIINLTIGLLHESLLRGAIPLHKSIGMLVLILSLVRLGWRFTHRPPPLPATVKKWEKGLAHAVHWLLYALMILIPLSGWVFTSASPKRHPLEFFGLFPLPMFPVAQDKEVSHMVAERHEQLAYLMIALLVLHICAALKHRFVDRDGTVARMLPGG